MTASLLALAPLRLEAWAVAAGAPGATVVRTGMGPRRSALTARRLRPAAAAPRPGRTVSPVSPLGPLGRRPTVVAVTGVGGALVGGLAPGDLVVADRILRPSGELVAFLPAAGLVADDLRRAGLVVCVGPIVSTARIVRGRAQRLALAAVTAAVAVDMESVALLDEPWGVPTVVVRAISDRPGQELWSPASPAHGLRALRALRAAAPVLERWAATTAVFTASPAAATATATAAGVALSSPRSPEVR